MNKQEQRRINKNQRKPPLLSVLRKDEYTDDEAPAVQRQA